MFFYKIDKIQNIFKIILAGPSLWLCYFFELWLFRRKYYHIAYKILSKLYNFLSMFEKLQNIVQAIHIRMDIAHAYSVVQMYFTEFHGTVLHISLSHFNRMRFHRIVKIFLALNFLNGETHTFPTIKNTF